MVIWKKNTLFVVLAAMGLAIISGCTTTGPFPNTPNDYVLKQVESDAHDIIIMEFPFDGEEYGEYLDSLEGHEPFAYSFKIPAVKDVSPAKKADATCFTTMEGNAILGRCFAVAEKGTFIDGKGKKITVYASRKANNEEEVDKIVKEITEKNCTKDDTVDQACVGAASEIAKNLPDFYESPKLDLSAMHTAGADCELYPDIPPCTAKSDETPANIDGAVPQPQSDPSAADDKFRLNDDDNLNGMYALEGDGCSLAAGATLNPAAFILVGFALAPLALQRVRRRR